MRQQAKRYKPLGGVAWAKTILLEPVRYGPFMTKLALRALHDAGELHDCRSCPLCQLERQAA
jgi:hypothetical protein